MPERSIQIPAQADACSAMLIFLRQSFSLPAQRVIPDDVTLIMAERCIIQATQLLARSVLDDAGAYRVAILDFSRLRWRRLHSGSCRRWRDKRTAYRYGRHVGPDEALPEPTDLDEIHAKRAAAGEPEGIDYRITLHEEHE